MPTDSWIERVRAADAEAEARWQGLLDFLEREDYEATAESVAMGALIVVAAELRAARIARRPGLGKP